MIFWIIGTALVLIIFAFVKFKYIKHKLSWIFILSFLFLFYITFMASIAGHNVNLNDFQGITDASKLYLIWMGNAFENIKSITGDVVKMDWNLNISMPFRN